MIQYDKPGDNQLRWRLRPQEQEWNTGRGVFHNLRYQTLPAGDYRLDYQGVSAAGVVSDIATTAFTVLPPYAQRWWAWLVYRLLGLATLTVALRLRTRQIMARNCSLEQTVPHKTARLAQQNAVLASAARDRAAFYSRTVHEIRRLPSLIRAPLNHALRLPDLPAKATRLVTPGHPCRHPQSALTEQMAVTAATPQGLDAGRATLDLASFVGPVVGFYRDIATEQGLAWTQDIQVSGLATLDPDACDAVLHNLMSNAVRHTPAGGTIHATVQTQDCGLDIALTNTAALPAVLAQHLTASATHPADAVPVKGLDIIGQTVLRLNGTLTVDNRSATTIRISLPCNHIPSADVTVSSAPVEAPDTATADATTNEPDAADTPTILIVEDDTDLRSFLSDRLAPVGISVPSDRWPPPAVP